MIVQQLVAAETLWLLEQVPIAQIPWGVLKQAPIAQIPWGVLEQAPLLKCNNRVSNWDPHHCH